MTPEQNAVVLQRWRTAGEAVAQHDEAQQAKFREAVNAAEAAVFEIVSGSSEPPSPTRVLEILARRRNGVSQAAGALAIQRLVARRALRLTADASLQLPEAEA